MRKKNEKKQKKEKIVYVDDGSTIVDLSALDPSRARAKQVHAEGSRPRWRQILQTYFDSVKLMLLPTLVFVCALALIFLLLWFLFSLAA